MARLLYFSWVREKIGAPAEEIDLPPDIITVSGLLTHLNARDTVHA
ncbi:MAG: molybdopterin synthase sulfur carrier subunit, partial [Magnetococcales bacterium]|nr:molybdopterin synthase sulfur carrier subunit [Magnetococcales bacterium]